MLSVKTTGPRRIAVGKESTYELIMSNAGQVAAEEVVVTVGLPEWADVVGTEATAGETDMAAMNQSPRHLSWKIARLAAKSQEKLLLRIVPRQSRPFDLAVRWDYTPLSSETMIEVQEPKLEMRLDGPRQVHYGQREVYRLELANTGNGDAENVELSLVPLGAGDNVSATYQLPFLGAGQRKAVDVELTARQAGTLTIKVDAKAEGGATASLTESITVLRAALKLDLEAPKMQFVGTQATYRVRIGNPGNAPAANLNVTARIPLGTKYVSCTGDGKLSPDRGELRWTVENLPPGAERSLELVGTLERPGTSRLEVSASADGDLTASAEASTDVEAVADLRLEVSDPAGPVPVGADALYEVEIRNRGSKSADEVEVAAYFSRGIEPVSAEGAPNKIIPGQVVFEKISSLAPGQSLRLKIRAKAEVAGNHVFRAEVLSKPAGARLVSEETTYFYGDVPVSSNADRSLASEPPMPPGQGQDRTADRRQAPTAPPSGGKPTPAPSMRGGASPQSSNTSRSLSNPVK